MTKRKASWMPRKVQNKDTRKAHNQAETVVMCPYCDRKAELINSIEIYKWASLGMLWICRLCDAYIGTHCNNPRNLPLGRLANKKLRKLKIEVHKVFDPLWNYYDSGKSRSEIYFWLAEKMKITRSNCNIAKFDVAQCNKAIKLCAKRMEKEYE